MELNREQIVNEIESLVKTIKATGGWVKNEKGEGWFNHEILSDALALIRELTEEKERLMAEKEAAVDDLEHCMHYAKPKNNNTCNFCLNDCESGLCKGREDWIECRPVWRGIVKAKGDVDQTAKELLEEENG